MAFDESAYYANKAKQLNETGYQGKKSWSVSDVKKAFADKGLSAKDHYNKYGKAEGVSPTSSRAINSSRPSTTNISSRSSISTTGNKRFDDTTYYNNKVAQLNQTNYQGRSDWTVGQVKGAFADNGLSAQDHYNRYGREEGVNPYAEVSTPTPSQQVARQAPQSTVTPEQTSQQQLAQILNSNSPLMRRASTQGMQVANSRGLLNSSMAAEASQGAMIDRATPLAQQDASTYFQNNQANAGRQQQAFLNDQQYRNQLSLNEQGYQFDMGRMQADYGFSSQLSTQEASQTLNQLYATSTANAWGVMANNLTDIVGQYSAQLERIQTNPDIEEEDKVTLIEQVLAMRDTDINFQRSLYEQLPTYLANTGVFPNR
ncbi:hypothetical protein [Vreelandella aquamarina]|uniref:hypothetical protein n=1 Tax=Vreelandella aquamarina TaxID=77097 RepID=UPI00384F9528